MSSTSSEYDEIRHAYEDAFHRWCQAKEPSQAEREYHELRDRLARYILEHAPPARRANGKADSSKPPAAVNAAASGA